MAFDLPPLPKLWVPPKPAIIRAAADVDLVRAARTEHGMVPFAGFRPRNRVVLTFVQMSVDATDLTTYTFTNHAIGTATQDRVVVVAVSGQAAGALQLNSMTIGGNAATLLTQPGGAALRPVSAIGGLWVPIGTTATIVVTFSAASARGIISVYTLTGTGGRLTPHDLKVDDTGATTSVSLVVPTRRR